MTSVLARIVGLEDVYVDITLGCTHQAVAGLADPQDVTGGEELGQVVLFGGDVIDDDENVHDGFRGEAGTEVDPMC
jgi:hypothetical protein